MWRNLSSFHHHITMRSKAEAAAFFDDCEREMRAKDAGCIISGLMMRAIKRESTGIDDSALTTKLTLQTPLTEISMNFTQDIPHPRSTEFAGTNSRMKTPLKRQHDNAEEAFDGPRRSSRLKKLKGSAISPIEGGEARARDYTKTTLCQSISATYFVCHFILNFLRRLTRPRFVPQRQSRLPASPRARKIRLL
ncbi:hypothetical protein CPB85DRAFT_1022084 [Mucidula mucida]|nr:hypothetical protein CPB85DRAFT_1022084 [Mucidula mucida]